MIGRRELWHLCRWLCACIAGVGLVHAQTTDADLENKVKAGYLGNFGAYIDWPAKAIEGDAQNFYIGVLGKAAVVPYLEKIAESKAIKNRKIVVRHFVSADEYKPCHILFVASEPATDKNESAEDRLTAALKKTQGGHVLLVGEHEGFAEKGAAINLFLDETRIRFEINPDAAKEAGLVISAKLLKLGKIVAAEKK